MSLLYHVEKGSSEGSGESNKPGSSWIRKRCSCSKDPVSESRNTQPRPPNHQVSTPLGPRAICSPGLRAHISTLHNCPTLAPWVCYQSPRSHAVTSNSPALAQIKHHQDPDPSLSVLPWIHQQPLDPRPWTRTPGPTPLDPRPWTRAPGPAPLDPRPWTLAPGPAPLDPRPGPAPLDPHPGSASSSAPGPCSFSATQSVRSPIC